MPAHATMSVAFDRGGWQQESPESSYWTAPAIYSVRQEMASGQVVRWEFWSRRVEWSGTSGKCSQNPIFWLEPSLVALPSPGLRSRRSHRKHGPSPDMRLRQRYCRRYTLGGKETVFSQFSWRTPTFSFRKWEPTYGNFQISPVKEKWLWLQTLSSNWMDWTYL